MSASRISRRKLLTGAPAAAILAPQIASAGPSAPLGAQNDGWYRFRFGAFEMTVISDGNLAVPAAGLGVNQPPETVRSFLEDRYLDPGQNYAHTNHLLIDTGTAKVLVDVGSGERFVNTAGRLSSNMVAAGIDPSDVTHVALTHGHPDHIWGMLDEFDELRFANAEYAMDASEFDWWTAEDRVDEGPEATLAMFVGAQTALTPIAARTAMAGDGHEIAPGIRMIATRGHTLGHMSLLVESEGETMLVIGDAIIHAHVSFERPDWHFGFDMDREMAIATRKRLLDMAANDGMTLVGYHLPFPGVGHVRRAGDAYRFIPDLWRWG